MDSQVRMFPLPSVNSRVLQWLERCICFGPSFPTPHLTPSHSASAHCSLLFLTLQAHSCLRAFGLAVLSGPKALPPDFYMTHSLISLKSVLPCRLPLEATLRRGAPPAPAHIPSLFCFTAAAFLELVSHPKTLFVVVQSLSGVQLRPHRPQHTRLPCPSPSPRAYSNSRPLSR